MAEPKALPERVCIVGYSQDGGGAEALGLARALAACGRTRLVVCVVTPEVWHPAALGADHEYGRFLDERAAEALDAARAALADLPGVRFEHITARSATQGLTQAAQQHQASLIVLGASRGSAVGRLFLGSVTDELLHLSALPVAAAPLGYTGKVPASRITVGFSGSDAARATVLHALGMAGAMGLPLRIATFGVHDPAAYAPRVGAAAEQAILERWTAQAREALDTVRGQIAVTGYPVDTAIGVGPDWEAALAGIAWQEGELLLLGSSGLGALQRVFLGSNAAQMLRAAQVPVVIVPRQGG